MKSKIISVLSSLLLCVTLIFGTTGCTQEVVTKEGFKILDTIILIKLYEYKDPKSADEAIELCKYYENLLSVNIETSDIYKLNHSGGAPVVVADDTIELLQKSIKYCEDSNGVQDITIQPVSSLWDFNATDDTHHGKVPDDALIKANLPKVNYKNIKIEGNTVTLLGDDTELNLGATAKGFIADKVGDFLKSKGVTSAIISLGGNLLTIGKKPGDKPFRVGILEPLLVNEDNKESAIVEITSEKWASVVTSGLYQRYMFDENENFYHHILDPKTGYPIKTDLQSISLISKYSVDCDGMDTALFIMGIDKAREYVEAHDDLEAVFIVKKPDGSFEVSYTSGVGPGTEIPITIFE